VRFYGACLNVELIYDKHILECRRLAPNQKFYRGSVCRFRQ